MIQFNLLPDVKQEYMKAKRQKHSVIVISVLAAAVSLFIFIMLFLTVNVFQKKHLSDLSNDITDRTKSLKANTDLDKVLTVQNQLNSLPALHDAKPVTSRLFGYLTQITPAQVSIGNIALDYEAKTMALSGTADSISTINKFVDTLKFTTYTEAVGSEAAVAGTSKPFTSVVLSSFSKSEKEATYQISFVFEPTIFDSSKTIALVVPKLITTRSETEKPKLELFKALPEKTTEGSL